MEAASKLGRTALVVWALLAPLVSAAPAQQPRPIHVLVLHWYGRVYPSNDSFDERLQQALHKASPAGVEYYSEYLETNRFPGEMQSRLLSEYLKQKYAGRQIDVLISGVSVTLNFLLEFRDELLPDTPIVFATERPVDAARIAKAGAAGFIYSNTYRRTIDLALRLHPLTEQVFVISGTLNHDKSLESVVRDQLDGYTRAGVTYLTDLTPEELVAKMQSLPKDSVVLYVWQQASDSHGNVIETQAILARIVPHIKVPLYGRSFAHVGLGVVGGYVWTEEGNAAKLASLTMRVFNGTRPQDIPIGEGTETPMFDWRQLQRWGISEDRLPAGNVIRFRQLSMWEQYRWRMVIAIAAFVLQASLIAALLVGRNRARVAQRELREYRDHLEQLVQDRTSELVHARDQALAANRSKSIFLAHMSHELRTPLNAILGFSGMVLNDADLSPQHRKDLAVVGSSGEHLLTLIDDVLDMAKIETGGVTVECASVDLHALVHETVNMLRERSLSKNLELHLEIAPHTPQFVWTDPGKLRQVLTNLVGNALKYTDEGSVVVLVDARTETNLLLTFDVEDTGIGIAPEDQARIFDPFVQAGGARSRKGTGLGLAISRHFVEILGGTIQVESTPGRGSRFHVEIPARAGKASDVARAPAADEQVAGLVSGQPDVRILIVEDQRENWLLLRRLLKTAGFAVRIAEDGAQAVEAYKAWCPNFIWMDLRLPVMSGLEAAKRIRKLNGGSEVKIVAVTASAFASQREDVLAAGFDDFLRKPYRPREIFDCMARHLPVRYRYKSRLPEENELSVKLREEDVAAIPAALREQLKSAIRSLDRDRIVPLVCHISALNPSLGNALEHFVAQYAYTPILEALQSCKSCAQEPGT